MVAHSNAERGRPWTTKQGATSKNMQAQQAYIDVADKRLFQVLSSLRMTVCDFVSQWQECCQVLVTLFLAIADCAVALQQVPVQHQCQETCIGK